MRAGELHLAGVSKSYLDGRTERRVLEAFALEVAPGETVAVCGPSGSGKSTLLNLIAGIVTADAGEIQIGVNAGEPVALHTLSARERGRFRRRHIGYVFQFFNLVPTLTVAENVQLPLKLNKCAHAWPQSQARLEQLQLGDRLQAFPDTLSGGERQRVAIARALAHEPDIVLADEPTGNLDVANTQLVADLLFGEAKRLGKTLVIATHNPEIAERAERRVDLA